MSSAWTASSAGARRPARSRRTWCTSSGSSGQRHVDDRSRSRHLPVITGSRRVAVATRRSGQLFGRDLVSSDRPLTCVFTTKRLVKGVVSGD
jgi:hypothetical protein